MTGPNNYRSDRVELLVNFVRSNPNIKREILLKRLGRTFLNAYNEAKHTGRIVPSAESTYRDKYWVVNERR